MIYLYKNCVQGFGGLGHSRSFVATVRLKNTGIDRTEDTLASSNTAIYRTGAICTLRNTAIYRTGDTLASSDTAMYRTGATCTLRNTAIYRTEATLAF